MFNATDELTADFYRHIHDLMRSNCQTKGAERRGQRRNAFRVVQRIAPCDGAEFPPDADFFEARCHDLNRAGFSFLVPKWPRFDRLVAEFGKRPHLIHVVAEVVHAEQVAVYASGRVVRLGQAACPGGRTSHTGQPMFLVGCRFLRRIERPRPV
jgi:hypothetical protein